MKKPSSPLRSTPPVVAEPLLDAEWLLGPRSKLRIDYPRFVGSLIGVATVLSCLLLFPTLSRLWLRSQLASQFHQVQSEEGWRNAIVGLAKLLPDSLDEISLGLQHTDPNHALAAYQALDDYVSRLEKEDASLRCAMYAKIAVELDEHFKSSDAESLQLFRFLASRIEKNEADSNHPASLISQTICRKLIKSADDQVAQLSHPIRDAATKTETAEPDTSNSLFDSIANVRTSASELAQSPLLALSTTTKDGDTSVSGELDAFPSLLSGVKKGASFHDAVLASSDSQETLPNRLRDTSAATPFKEPSAVESSSIRSSNLRATGLVSDTNQALMQSNGDIDWKPDAAALNRVIPVSAAKTITVDKSSEEREASLGSEVVGIRRQSTFDLLQLLSSQQERLALAAFHELEKNRLNAVELTLAVELAKGTPSMRIDAMERLAVTSGIDPGPWLFWMGHDTNRDVRSKAVSILASLGSRESQAMLRLLHSREHDASVSQHILQALQANGLNPTGDP